LFGARRTASRSSIKSDELYAYIGGILGNKKAKLLAAGGMEDHIHILASLPATASLAIIVPALRA
jgi:REP element-mobilizing transposase RayT